MGKINWFKIIRYSSVGLAVYLLIVMVLFILNKTAPIKKNNWFNVIIFIRTINMIATAYTALRICRQNSEIGNRIKRFGCAVHYILFILMSCSLLYLDPLTTFLLAEVGLDSMETSLERATIAYFIVSIVYMSLYLISEVIGPRAAGGKGDVEAQDDE
ncbi:hypothetical protein GGI26_003114 [Coemansia sp. RSA 1358]|nr:hypothetical protein GGI26_003114 [Coemansia sp. RSA 1358]